ncbi:Spermidine/putrescine import ATP-binding protein PotA [Desulfosarcina cetonica]|uniref:ABC transporter ATP-binding protein n=1 Tax=Desulfosarcina cetonica TaxID=90730 RepID=UPI0006CF2D1E|nr:ABC transporter ATP-binding protein [Desulfosarcina cetonica]VTR70284.1 Spermidine/putrescine import ATP-binding protein PotA [Desulfosarcina cetonica]
MTDLPILQIAGLRKEYGSFVALKDIDLKVREGEFLTIVGPSGSGKTTLIKLLVGMEEQTEGSIWLRNIRLDRVPANQRPTCMVFQSLALFPHRSVGQNVEFPLKIKGVPAAKRKARALELLAMFRLPESYFDKRIGQCSGGERQRIALARALAFDPEILFFDEPLSALDYRLRKTLEKELKALHLRTGKTFIYITHSLEEAMVMSDRIAILRAGRFEQIGTAEAIYNHPKSCFVAGFMGDVNLFDIGRDADSGSLTVPHFSISASAAKALVLPPDKKNTLMVRPEAVRLLAGDETADFVTRGEVTGHYLLGSRTQLEITQPDGKLIVVETANHGQDGHVGAAVRLGFDGAMAHLISEAIR